MGSAREGPEGAAIISARPPPPPEARRVPALRRGRGTRSRPPYPRPPRVEEVDRRRQRGEIGVRAEEGDVDGRRDSRPRFSLPVAREATQGRRLRCVCRRAVSCSLPPPPVPSTRRRARFGRRPSGWTGRRRAKPQGMRRRRLSQGSPSHGGPSAAGIPRPISGRQQKRNASPNLERDRARISTPRRRAGRGRGAAGRKSYRGRRCRVNEAGPPRRRPTPLRPAQSCPRRPSAVVS